MIYHPWSLIVVLAGHLKRWKIFSSSQHHSANFVFTFRHFVWKEIPAHLLDEALLQDDDAEPLGCE